MKKSLALLLLVPVVLITACGGGGSSPEDEVTDTVNQILEAEEPDQIETVCRELTTQRFIDEVYGDVERCIEKPLSDDGELEDPGETEVESVQVDDETAKVKVTTVGGDIAGAGGTLAMVDDGDGWKLDRLEDDYLRSTFSASVDVVDEGVFSYEPMRECMSGQIGKLKSGQLRGFVFQVLRDQKKKATESVLAIAKKCPQPMAEFVADELATRVIAAEGGSPSQVKCARKALVPYLMLTDLSSMALNDDGSGFTGAALAGLISGVIKECPGPFPSGG